MVNLKDFIEKTHLENTDEKQNNGNSAFDTEDYVFLESHAEVESLFYYHRIAYASDYAVMNSAELNDDYYGPIPNRLPTFYWLRSAVNDFSPDFIDAYGRILFVRADEKCALCPSMHLNLSNIISARRSTRDFRIASTIDKDGEILHHTIEFGSYPQDKAENSDELEKLYNENKLTPTGKTYTGYTKKNGSYQQNEEFIYNGKKYVRVVSVKYRFDSDYEYKDHSPAAKNGTRMWVKVQPIKWKIKNWDEMPKEINPKGNGKAKYIDVRTEDAILAGVPFYHDDHVTICSMWQNSPLRAILNGYDLQEEILNGNGNKDYKATVNYNFKGKGFLQEAFEDFASKMEQTDSNIEVQLNVCKTRLQKLNPDTMQEKARRNMTDTEVIKSWIDAGQSVLLRGPSGIGKTERIKKLYPDLIYIKLTNNMFPEKVVGSMNLQTGESIPPDFAKQALLSCATEEEKKLIKENVQNLYDLADTIYERSKTAKGKVVILLDELLNVKPAVQSLVYTLVLNRLVETGKGLKLPANTVVVATGNQKKFSSVAEDLAEPLEKRFDHILDMQPKVREWLYEYAIPNKLHPSVIAYIFSKYQENNSRRKNKDISYFYEEPEVGEKYIDENGCRGKTNDPRGWDSVSRTLYAFEEDLQNGKFAGKNVEEFLRVTLRSKLREEWAEEFFNFYNIPTITVEDVVNKKYTEIDLPRDVNEKFAVVSSLLSATPNQVDECRKFIRLHCDPEYLAVYDLYWVGNDEERMEKLAEIKALETESLEN